MAIILKDSLSDILLLTSVFIILVYWYVQRIFTYWQRRGVPVISYSIPFGNFGPILRQHKSLGLHLADLYDASKERYIGIYAMITPMLLLCDPQLIRTAFIRDFDYFHDRTTQVEGKNEPILLHLVSLHGEEWKTMRQMLTPTFTSGKLKAMLSTMISCGDGLKPYLDKLTDTKDTQVEVRELCARFTTNVIASVAFGIEINSIADPDTDFRKYGRLVRYALILFIL